MSVCLCVCLFNTPTVSSLDPPSTPLLHELIGVSHVSSNGETSA